MLTSATHFVFSRLIRSMRALIVFFFNDPATTEIYTLSLHDALPIYASENRTREVVAPSVTFATWFELLVMPGIKLTAKSTGADDDFVVGMEAFGGQFNARDRKSTRLNSSHTVISYAVFCLKKKKKKA